jgi:hypothetical protein
MDRASERGAAAAEVRRMVRDVDDAVVSDIIRTGASAAEVPQAVLRGGGSLEDEASSKPHDLVNAVYAILQAEEHKRP